MHLGTDSSQVTHTIIITVVEGGWEYLVYKGTLVPGSRRITSGGKGRDVAYDDTHAGNSQRHHAPEATLADQRPVPG